MKKSPTFFLFGSDRTPRVLEPGEIVEVVHDRRFYEAVDARANDIMGLSPCIYCDANGRTYDCGVLRCRDGLGKSVYYKEVPE